MLAALRIASDGERVGDYAVNTAKYLLSLERAAPEPFAGRLVELAKLAAAMFRDVLRVWRDHDAASLAPAAASSVTPFSPVPCMFFF